MKNYGKVIGFIFLLLFFYGSTPSLQSKALADDSFSPGPQWQEIPAYGPELTALATSQETASTNDADETSNNSGILTTSNIASGTNSSNTGGMGNMLGGLMGGTGGMGNMLGGLMGGNLFGTSSTQTYTNSTSSGVDSTQSNEDLGIISVNFCGTEYDDLSKAPALVQSMVYPYLAMPIDNSTYGLTGPVTPGGVLSLSVTADFDPCKPGRETKWYSPLVIDVDTNGAIALDGGTIPFDIAPHIAGLETIPVPASGKDMFLVWDKAGTETIEGIAREYKDGEIVDITELFGPTDYTRSDFSNLAYTDDGFTKLRKLCDVDNDGDVDKQDTALSAEVSAKLKLWSPLSGQLILFKDTDIVVDVRAGSYERHPSDIEGWAVEYKMKDTQDRLVGYQWLTSKTSSLLCVDVLLAIQ